MHDKMKNYGCYHFLFFVWLFVTNVSLSSASPKPAMLVACNVSAENYPGLKNTIFRKEVTLTGSQLTDEGNKFIGNIGDFEFWLETNMLSLQGDQPQIIDFVIKVKNSQTGISQHAFSGLHALSNELMFAKIRLVVYKKDGVSESGSLEIDCLTKDVPKKPVFVPLISGVPHLFCNFFVLHPFSHSTRWHTASISSHLQVVKD